MRTALYARVSTRDKSHDVGMQVREFQEFCQRRNWAVADQYIDDGISSSKERVERRTGFRVQGAEADELRAVTSRPGDPVLLPQIIEQRKALFEFFDVLAHGAVLPLEANVGESRQHSQARMVGRGKFLRDARAREFAEPESAKTKAQVRNRHEHH